MATLKQVDARRKALAATARRERLKRRAERKKLDEPYRPSETPRERGLRVQVRGRTEVSASPMTASPMTEIYPSAYTYPASDTYSR